MNEEEEKQAEEVQDHRGAISISMRYLKHLLQLPESYEVETVHLDWAYNKLRVYVTSPLLPLVGEYQQITEVVPKYRWTGQDGASSPELVDIELVAYPPRTKEELLASL